MWGATRQNYAKIFNPCFNPRTRVGCDRELGGNPMPEDVSIHAPVWGATFQLHVQSNRSRFNPRTRVGCDNRTSL